MVGTACVITHRGAVLGLGRGGVHTECGGLTCTPVPQGFVVAGLLTAQGEVTAGLVALDPAGVGCIKI